MRIRILFLTAIAVILFSKIFSQDKQVEIDCQVKNLDVAQVALIRITDNKTIAEKPVINRKSSLTLSLEKMNVFKLQFSEEHLVFLILHPGEKVSVVYDAKKNWSPEISGSPHSSELYSISNQLETYDKKLIEYQKQIEKEKNQYLIEQLKNDDQNVAMLFFLKGINIKDHPDVFKEYVKGLRDEYGEHVLVDELEGIVNKELGFADNKAPEISLPNPEGEIIKLSSFRGNFVLIDFWAAWCGPCRRQNPHLVELYNKYKHKDFEILGVSLDRSRQTWLNAIEKDNLIWPQVSDLKFWNSEVVSDYSIEAIPHSVLIDKNGKIIATGLRGEKLAAKLEEIFGE